MHTNILIATDGSELAAKGVEQGVRLAAGLGARVTFVTVSEPLPILRASRESAISGRNEFAAYQASAEAAAEEILAAAKAVAAAGGVESTGVHVFDRHPADAILSTRKEEGCDLIVMTSHGRRGLGRLLLGSQTVEVLTHSTVPVLVIR